ncbi:MAG: hypothetical protein QQN55_01320 [Nitrosopumilus sp.]
MIHIARIMVSEKFDEECLLKDINCSKLSAAITKLTFSWDNYSNPVEVAHELMNRYRKLSLEILEYEQRMGSKLSKYQRSKLDISMEDLAKVIPYMENKIQPSAILEKKFKE